MAVNKWYVITGGPSSGKTSLINELSNKGYHVVNEAGRSVIDEGLASGKTIKDIRRDEESFQYAVLDRKKEIEEKHKPNLITFFDRGMHDTVAYLKHYGWKLNRDGEEIINKSSYAKVFLLDPLPSFESDYARTEDPNFVQRIPELLFEAYRNAGLEPLRVPVLPLEDRVKFILEKVEA